MSGFATRLLVGAASLVACTVAAAPASAQDNVFVPSGGASRVEMERMEARMKALEAKIAAGATAKTTAAAGVPGVAGAAGVPGSGPGSPIPGSSAAGGPLNPGAPGGIAPYGAPGGTVATVDPWTSKLAQQYGVSNEMVQQAVPGLDTTVFIRMSSGQVRFIGCINGVPKFTNRQNGQRVAFSTRDINEAQKAGVVPTCR